MADVPLSEDRDSSFKCNLELLPVPALYLIFHYLDIKSIFKLSLVCKKFYCLIRNDYINSKSKTLLVTNQCSNKVRERSSTILSAEHKFRNYCHWLEKNYHEYVFLVTAERFRPWLQLRGKDLFISQGKRIMCFQRNEKGINKKPKYIYTGHRDDVVRFFVKDNIMVSGGNDGKIICWNIENNKPLFYKTRTIRFIDNLYTDFKQNTVAAGNSLSGRISIYSVNDNTFDLKVMTSIRERVRSIALSEDAAQCAIGCGGYQPSPLKILDVNSSSYTYTTGNFKNGAGIFDVVWETPHTLLTAGFDTMLNVWDTRLGRTVLSWSDPYDAAVYTVATDYNHTIMSGSAMHSRITLWDKRLPSKIQTYFVSKGKVSSPVYSFDFDPSYMFVALDTSLYILNFSKGKLCGT